MARVWPQHPPLEQQTATTDGAHGAPSCERYLSVCGSPSAAWLARRIQGVVAGPRHGRLGAVH